MKIVGIEDLHCNAGWRDFSFLKITTDDGLVGWSEYNEGYGSAGLTAVIRRMIEAPGTFDRDGWLTIGFCGHQPGIGEGYISTGSLYLCAVGLLPLGLPPEDEFWAAPARDWTARRVWSGSDSEADHAI